MSKDNDNLNNIRRWWVRRLPGFYTYVSTLPDSHQLMAEITKDDPTGRKWMMAVTDEILTRMGHPVKTQSAAEKAWKHVFGS